MPTRPCLDCGKLSTTGTRCPTCSRARQRGTQQAKRTRRPAAGRAETQRRADTVAAHRATHGDWCPGWRRPPHPSTDLTADHVTEVALGGAEAGPLTVLCRTCNSRKGATLTASRG